MIEEGWYDHPAIHAAVETYLAELDGFDYDRLILGCTHYPLIHDLLQRRVGQAVTVIDSSDAVAAMIPPRRCPSEQVTVALRLVIHLSCRCPSLSASSGSPFMRSSA